MISPVTGAEKYLKNHYKVSSQTEVGRLLEVHFIGGETYARIPNEKDL
jgi:hypothetical protein